MVEESRLYRLTQKHLNLRGLVTGGVVSRKKGTSDISGFRFNQMQHLLFDIPRYSPRTEVRRSLADAWAGNLYPEQVLRIRVNGCWVKLMWSEMHQSPVAFDASTPDDCCASLVALLGREQGSVWVGSNETGRAESRFLVLDTRLTQGVLPVIQAKVRKCPDLYTYGSSRGTAMWVSLTGEDTVRVMLWNTTHMEYLHPLFHTGDALAGETLVGSGDLVLNRK